MYCCYVIDLCRVQVKFLYNCVLDFCVYVYNEEWLFIMNVKGYVGNVKKFMNEFGYFLDIFFLVKGLG